MSLILIQSITTTTIRYLLQVLPCHQQPQQQQQEVAAPLINRV